MSDRGGTWPSIRRAISPSLAYMRCRALVNIMLVELRSVATLVLYEDRIDARFTSQTGLDRNILHIMFICAHFMGTTRLPKMRAAEDGK